MPTTAMNRRAPKPTDLPDAYADVLHTRAVMRQTQALIGVALLAGVAGAFFVGMEWIVVPALIGLGLVFAGASGVCPLASLIAYMPWNRPADGTHHPRSPGCCGGRCS